MDEAHVEKKHPRAESIKIREAITRSVEANVVALAGLIAHGRGEAFDYILGEKTTSPGMKAITASAAYIILAEHPILSVNGNVAALCAEEFVELSKISNSKLEVNLFHRTLEREIAIENLLKKAGADKVLGVGEAASSRIQEIFSDRRRVDPEGIFKADVVFVPLEDGDRTQGLVKMGKKVLTVDLNPLSRTAQWANVTIVDNIIRAMPLLISEVKRLKTVKPLELKAIIKNYDNKKVLSEAMIIMEQRLHSLAEKGVYLDIDY
ncbi:phosphopantothenate/pantothenate synthetase [Candidatus Bathyarchaeota archaeon]|nr:phosphopantothenate/pantothenate synthetase [Candidatus Bathyarchaeota archaeon]